MNVQKSGPDRLSAAGIVGFTYCYLQIVVASLVVAAKRSLKDDVPTLAAAVAYYLALSLLPLLMLLISGLGLGLRFTHLGRDSRQTILDFVADHCSPILKSQIETVLGQFEEQAIIGGPLALFLACATAIGVFHQFEKAFDQILGQSSTSDRKIYQIAADLLVKRLTAFLMLVCVGACILLVLLANTVLAAAMHWLDQATAHHLVPYGILDPVATIAANTCAFTVLYRVLPKAKIRWIEAFRSGLLVALLWEVSRRFILSLYVGATYTSSFGAIGSFILLLLWFYWGVAILLFGAEYIQVLRDTRDGNLARSIEEE